MQIADQVKTEIEVIQQEYRQTEAIRIAYALYRISAMQSTHYAVEISAEEENDMRMLGSDPGRAEKLFEILVNETVTPCALRDVLHDIETDEEENEYRKNLI